MVAPHLTQCIQLDTPATPRLQPLPPHTPARQELTHHSPPAQVNPSHPPTQTDGSLTRRKQAPRRPCRSAWTAPSGWSRPAFRTAPSRCLHRPTPRSLPLLRAPARTPHLHLSLQTCPSHRRSRTRPCPRHSRPDAAGAALPSPLARPLPATAAGRDGGAEDAGGGRRGGRGGGLGGKGRQTRPGVPVPTEHGALCRVACGRERQRERWTLSRGGERGGGL